MPLETLDCSYAKANAEKTLVSIHFTIRAQFKLGTEFGKYSIGMPIAVPRLFWDVLIHYVTKPICIAFH